MSSRSAPGHKSKYAGKTQRDQIQTQLGIVLAKHKRTEKDKTKTAREKKAAAAAVATETQTVGTKDRQRLAEEYAEMRAEMGLPKSRVNKIED